MSNFPTFNLHPDYPPTFPPVPKVVDKRGKTIYIYIYIYIYNIYIYIYIYIYIWVYLKFTRLKNWKTASHIDLRQYICSYVHSRVCKMTVIGGCFRHL